MDDLSLCALGPILIDDNDSKNNSLNKKIIKIQEKKIEVLTQQFIINNTFILND
jgi:hypothetical protein